MKAILIIATCVIWDLLLPTLLGAPGPHVYWPKMAVFWVCFMAEEEPEFVARAQEVFWSGLLMSILLGLLTDFGQGAPRGLHAALFAFSYFLQRLLTRRELSPLVLFITVALVGGLIEAATWYVKGFSIGWVVLPRFQPYLYVVQGALLGLMALMFFKPLDRRLNPRR